MMKSDLFLILLVFVGAALVSGVVFAEGPEPTWVTDAPAIDAPPPPDVGQQLEDLKVSYEQLRGANGGTMAAWFVLLAALTNILLTVVKKVMKLTSRGKRYLPWLALGLGVAVGFFEAYTGSLITALVYGAGPPAAVLLQELMGVTKEPA